jgi:hypothetical protein
MNPRSLFAMPYRTNQPNENYTAICRIILGHRGNDTEKGGKNETRCSWLLTVASLLPLFDQIAVFIKQRNHRIVASRLCISGEINFGSDSAASFWKRGSFRSSAEVNGRSCPKSFRYWFGAKEATISRRAGREKVWGDSRLLFLAKLLETGVATQSVPFWIEP